LPGASETATAAAWGNRLDEPMTKVSNVYFGLSRDSGVCGTWPAGCIGVAGGKADRIASKVGVPGSSYVGVSTCRFVDMSPNPFASGGSLSGIDWGIG
jgi:hypothetical protein